MGILQQLAVRYADRPGGYTRLHLFGNRQGDNAPRALLELVDNDKGDLRMEMTARAMGREALLALKRQSPGVRSSRFDTQVFANPSLTKLEDDKTFNELTRINIAKVVKYDGAEKRAKLYALADEHFRRLIVAETLEGPRRPDEARMATDEWEKNGPQMDSDSLVITPTRGRQYNAGVQLADMPHGRASPMRPTESRPLYGRSKNSVVRLGKGAFAKRSDFRVKPSAYKGARGVVERWTV